MISDMYSLFFSVYHVGWNDELLIDITILGNNYSEIYFPEEKVNEFVKATGETVPALTIAYEYGYTYKHTSITDVMGVFIYGTFETLLDRYMDILYENKWTIDISYLSSSGFYLASSPAKKISMQIRQIYDEYGSLGMLLYIYENKSAA